MIDEIDVRTTQGTLYVTKENGATLGGQPLRITGATTYGDRPKRCVVFGEVGGEKWNFDAPTRQIEVALALLADGKNGDIEAGRVLARLIRIGAG